MEKPPEEIFAKCSHFWAQIWYFILKSNITREETSPTWVFAKPPWIQGFTILEHRAWDKNIWKHIWKHVVKFAVVMGTRLQENYLEALHNTRGRGVINFLNFQGRNTSSSQTKQRLKRWTKSAVWTSFSRCIVLLCFVFCLKQGVSGSKPHIIS